VPVTSTARHAVEAVGLPTWVAVARPAPHSSAADAEGTVNRAAARTAPSVASHAGIRFNVRSPPAGFTRKSSGDQRSSAACRPGWHTPSPSAHKNYN
jgi:hypothetical protein